MEAPIMAKSKWKEPKNVNIKKAANGFVISTYTDTGETIEVAKTLEEAQKIAKKILGK